MFGERTLLKEAQCVDWNSSWLGPTGYIDSVGSSELSQTISYGVDDAQRSFIFVKLQRYTKSEQNIIGFPLSKEQCADDNFTSLLAEQSTHDIFYSDPEDSQHPTKILNGLLVVFQRYSQSSIYVACAPGGGFLDIFLQGRCAIDNNLAADITTLVKKREMICVSA